MGRVGARVFLAMLPLWGTACAHPSPRRPIEELWREALESSRLPHDPAQSVLDEALAQEESEERVAAIGSEVPACPPASSALVSETFVETDLREAIQLLADQARVRVAVDDAIRGTARASFEGVPFETALSHLLVGYGYVFVRRGDEYVVGSHDPRSVTFPLVAETYTFQPRHARAQELLESLPPFAREYAQVGSTRGVVTVTAPRELAVRILTDLARADRPISLVALEAIVCEYSPNSRTELGFDVEHGFLSSGGKYTNLGLNGLQGTAFVAPAGTPGLRSFEFYSTLVRALATEGYVSLRAAPRVMVQDGERASISIGDETYFVVGSTNNNVFFFSQLQKIETGIALELTPRVSGSRVSVKLERAEVSDELRGGETLAPPGSPLATLPSVSRRRVATTIHLRDGETIVIGGLTRKRRVERVTRVPVLGSIPILGLLFQHSDEREEESEVTIFISPRIVRPG